MGHATGTTSPSAAAARSVDITASPAFIAKTLRSSVHRAYAVLGLAFLLLVFPLFRGNPETDPRLQLTAASGIAVLIALQLVVIVMARRQLEAGASARGLPNWFSATTVVAESLIPVGMIVSNIASGSLSPYASLGSPPVFVYGVIITLSTLRLQPGLCVLSGAVVAGGYSVVLLYITFGLGLRTPTTGLPYVAYVTSALMIFLAGLAAAWVAKELRTHVESALGEAELRHKKDRMERDLAAARTIQQALLPKETPTVPGFEIAGWNRPTDQTGGDYYDWQAMPDGRWMVTVADVSGHGIGPALVTAACRAYVRANGQHHGDLAELTTRVNRLLADDLPEGRFVTMVSALIDPREKSVALLSAGHGPIVLLQSASGEVRDILPRDLPLAIMADSTFGPAEPVAMQPGDVLALVTDGYVEWPRLNADGRAEQFGIDRLRESLRQHGRLRAAEMIQAITADVERFADPTPQHDDLTLTIIRRVD